MYKTNTLNDITYRDQWYKIGSPINVDDKDVDKLVGLGAIPARKHPEVIVIKNPVEVEEEVPEEIIFREDTIEVKEESEERPTWETDLQSNSGKVKRKYNRRDKEFRKRR